MCVKPMQFKSKSCVMFHCQTSLTKTEDGMKGLGHCEAANDGCPAAGVWTDREGRGRPDSMIVFSISP